MSRRGRNAAGLHAARVRRPQLRDRGPQQEPLDSDDDRSAQVHRVHSEQLHLRTLTHLGDASAASAGRYSSSLSNCGLFSFFDELAE